MRKGNPSRSVCGSCGVYLDCVLPGVQVTAGLGFFLHSSHLIDCEDSDSLLHNAYLSLEVPSGIVIRNRNKSHITEIRKPFRVIKCLYIAGIKRR